MQGMEESKMSDDFVAGAPAAGGEPPAHKRKSASEDGEAKVDESTADESASKRQRTGETDQIASVSNSAVHWQPRVWSELTTDFLESITQFAALADLARVARTCRSWRSTISLIAPHACRLSLHASLHVLHIAESSLSKHLTSLQLSESHPLHPSDFKLIQLVMPQLQHLKCFADATTHPRTVHRVFPPSLTDLDLTCHLPTRYDEAKTAVTDAVCWQHVQRGMEDIGRAAGLIQLRLTVKELGRKMRPLSMPASVLRPIARLQNSLQSLTLKLPHEEEEGWNEEHFQVLRSLDQLTELDIQNGAWSNQELQWYLAAPVPKLKQLNISGCDLEEAECCILQTVTTLTSFAPRYIDATDLSFLGSFDDLRMLRLCAIPDIGFDLTTMPPCDKVEKLHLEYDAVMAEELTQMLESMTRLRSLTLEDGELVDLTFLENVPHLRNTLDELKIIRCKNLPVESLSCLRQLTSLTSLVLHHSFTSSFDGHTLSCLTPGSRGFLQHCWPNLKQFKYDASPDRHDGSDLDLESQASV
jgi:hypothetical protein